MKCRFRYKAEAYLPCSSYPISLFHDGDRYHIETSPLICGENQWTGFYMLTASVMKELKRERQHKVSERISTDYKLKNLLQFYPFLY